MGESQRKFEVPASSAEPSKVKPKREYADPLVSTRGGFAGIFETIMRRFKLAMHLALISPVYAVGSLVLGAALAPAIFVFELASRLAQGQSGILKYFIYGTGASLGFFAYGFSLILILPSVNFIFRTRLKPWRGPYYSIEAIRWFVHNGATYIARFTFLEFVTPTPFNILFYRLMGMKIGNGVMINTTWISDPSMIEIGDKATIGGSVTLTAHYGQGGYLVLAPTKIGQKVTIGLKATVMGGVVIGDDAKILPHSVVLPKTIIPAGETWGGVPAQKIESVSELKNTKS